MRWCCVHLHTDARSHQVSIRYGCVLRGDLNNILVDAWSNIQDRTVIHAARCVCCTSNDVSYVAPCS